MSDFQEFAMQKFALVILLISKAVTRVSQATQTDTAYTVGILQARCSFHRSEDNECILHETLSSTDYRMWLMVFHVLSCPSHNLFSYLVNLLFGLFSLVARETFLLDSQSLALLDQLFDANKDVVWFKWPESEIDGDDLFRSDLEFLTILCIWVSEDLLFLAHNSLDV